MPASLPPPADILSSAARAPLSAVVRHVVRKYTLKARLPFQAEGQLTYQEPTEIVVLAGEQEYDPTTGVYKFLGGVKVTYGVTTLLADNFVVREAATLTAGTPTEGTPTQRPPVSVAVGDRTVTLETEQGFAFGNVRILDPDGTVNADSFLFRWSEGARSGVAENVTLQIGPTQIRGSRIEYSPEKTTLYDASGTACRRTIPFLAARSRQVDIIPGRSATVQRPQFQLFGQRLPALPTNIAFSLDPRAENLRIPRPSFGGAGVGVTGGGSQLLNPQTVVGYNLVVFPEDRPRYGFHFHRTDLAPEVPQGRLRPISDFDERFFYSWFTSVMAPQPQSEVDYLRLNRSSYGVATEVNVSARGRVPGGGLYTKLLEGVVERGGPLGPGGFQTQLRASVFQEGSESIGPRMNWTGDYAQILGTRGRLTTIGRLDSSLVAGKGLYGFAGGEIGGAYTAMPGVRFGASVFAYAQAGDSGYTLDRLRYPAGFSLRADANSAPTKLSLLFRFDERGRQFDREYRFSQVIGCLEPVITYREYPQAFQLGLRFRLDDVANLLQRLGPKGRRTKPNPFER